MLNEFKQTYWPWVTGEKYNRLVCCYGQALSEIEELRKQLEEATRNDARDPKTGRFKKKDK